MADIQFQRSLACLWGENPGAYESPDIYQDHAAGLIRFNDASRICPPEVRDVSYGVIFSLGRSADEGRLTLGRRPARLGGRTVE